MDVATMGAPAPVADDRVAALERRIAVLESLAGVGSEEPAPALDMLNLPESPTGAKEIGPVPSLSMAPATEPRSPFAKRRIMPPPPKTKRGRNAT